MDLPMVWAALIAFAVLMYVLLDGFDLGVGILFATARDDSERDVMMNSVAPIWDGNETWLVLGGGGLFAAFPVAYAIIMPALYFPVLIMLIALIFRGVAFEFRFKAKASRYLWDRAFIFGSLTATFSQGLVLGGFLQGFEVRGGRFAGGMFDWFSLFGVFVGIAMVCGYALLGATWLIIKTEGELQGRMYRFARRLLWGVVGFIVVVSLWTPWYYPPVADRWFDWPQALYVAWVPLTTALLVYGAWRSLARGREVLPFVLSLGLFLLGYIGLAYSLFPYVAPPAITIWQGASTANALMFLLVGALVMIPIILIYSGYSYFVFRGKVRPDMGYH